MAITGIINKMIPISDIIPHERNYRSHPDEQLSDLGASHKRFSQYRSVVLWQRPNGKYIQVAGHGIVEAMKRNWAVEVRADILPEDTPQSEIDAILVADNNLALKASDDETALVQLLQEQADAGYDLASLGSDEESLRQMLEGLGDAMLDDKGNSRTTELKQPEGGNVESGYNVLVMCESEAEQQRAYEIATGEGFTCRVLTL